MFGKEDSNRPCLFKYWISKEPDDTLTNCLETGINKQHKIICSLCEVNKSPFYNTTVPRLPLHLLPLTTTIKKDDISTQYVCLPCVA